jgi:hypothetical protein
MHLRSNKSGDAVGRPGCRSSLLGDPGAKFLVETGHPNRTMKNSLNYVSTCLKVVDTRRLLAVKFKKNKIDGHRELRHKRYVQWSILQHYEVLTTPLLDLTQSLRVACSFAQLKSTDSECYVYALGSPYLTNRISINSEYDLVNIRLLSICPPAALRPCFQEGYLAGTGDITTDFESKTELDFRNRLIAKFAIPRTQTFWGTGFDQIPESALFPKGDEILEVCNQLKGEIRDELRPGDLGAFIREWATLETFLLENARRFTNRNVSTREAIWSLAKDKILPPVLAQQLDALRSFRNTVVHQPDRVQSKDLEHSLFQIRTILQEVKKMRLPHKFQP